MTTETHSGLSQLGLLLKHEWQLEWRQRTALGGVALYAVGAVYVVFISLGLKAQVLTPPVWNSLVWVVLLFTALTSIAKSFSSLRREGLLYYYSVVPASQFLLAKIIYNTALTALLGLLSLGLFSIWIGNPVQHLGNYMLSLCLGAFSLAGTLTLVAAIATKAGGNGTLMPVLGFPLCIPQLLLLIKLSKHAMDGLETSFADAGLWPLLGLASMVIALSYLLFPYLWRS